MTPRDGCGERGDDDVGGDADRLHGEAEDLAVEERAEQPEDVEERRRVVAEVSRLVEPSRAHLRDTLAPRLERSDVGGEPLRAHHEEAQHDAKRDHPRDREAGIPIA